MTSTGMNDDDLNYLNAEIQSPMGAFTTSISTVGDYGISGFHKRAGALPINEAREDHETSQIMFLPT